MKLIDGENTVLTTKSGEKIVAESKNGKVVRWQIKGRDGKDIKVTWNECGNPEHPELKLCCACTTFPADPKMGIPVTTICYSVECVSKE